jgi:DNA-directed RNA polymerase specialized sigma24 family protein
MKQVQDVADCDPPLVTACEVRDDAAIIALSSAAPECLALLFDRHARAIHSYVARRLGPDAADDLTAEAFLIAFARRETYDSAYANARPWLYAAR